MPYKSLRHWKKSDIIVNIRLMIAQYVYLCFIKRMTMSYHETKFYSILNNKCPRCHEGNFFETNNPYDLNRFARMHNNCEVCQEDLRRETGFYFGAAYVSYGLTVGFGIGLFLLMHTWLNLDVFTFLITFTTLLIILMPLFYRYSRLIWIHLFVPFKGKK